MRQNEQRAFTLIELVIVITIIALLVAGVLVGQSLIRSSELNSVLKDANSYIFAVGNFKQQYRALPGDMLNATSYWSGSAVGDGSSTITGNERFRAWEHLYLAGFVAQKMSGASGSGGGGTNDFVIGTNVPSSKFKNGGFALAYSATWNAGTNSIYAATYGNVLTFGASAGTDNNEPIYAILTPTDAYNLDVKADDGYPGQGKWIANSTGPSGAASPYRFNDGASTCTTSTANTDTSSTYVYQQTNSLVSCSLFIKTGY